MLPDFNTALEQYAELVVKVGVNIQPGQRLLMWRVPPESVELARLIAAKAYDAGASLVDVMWDDDGLKLARFEHAQKDTFDQYNTWQSIGMKEHVDNGGALISIRGNHPNLLKGQDPVLVSKVQTKFLELIEPAMYHVSQNSVNWLVVGAATPGWAQTVYPDLSPQDAVAKLWETIFELCRLNEPDPLAAWNEHLDQLEKRSRYMNERQYAALKLKGPGTDLTLGLPKGHIWKGGGSVSKSGVPFCANLPTEEIFTVPHSDMTEGIVRASLPLSYGGSLIEDFSLKFEKGRATEVTARSGEDILRYMIANDEGAARLGEVALVPQSSPIARKKRLFFHTLFDENASSHIALGRSYRMNYDGANAMTVEELMEAGCNQSLIHVDFMIGSEALDIDGVRIDGAVEPVMRSGEWAFEV